MTEYTPTLAEQLIARADDLDTLGCESEREEANYVGQAQALREVAALLAEHDRQVAEQAWDEGYAARTVYNEHTRRIELQGATNPYRTNGTEQ